MTIPPLRLRETHHSPISVFTTRTLDVLIASCQQAVAKSNTRDVPQGKLLGLAE